MKPRSASKPRRSSFAVTSDFRCASRVPGVRRVGSHSVTAFFEAHRGVSVPDELARLEKTAAVLGGCIVGEPVEHHGEMSVEFLFEDNATAVRFSCSSGVPTIVTDEKCFWSPR